MWNLIVSRTVPSVMCQLWDANSESNFFGTLSIRKHEGGLPACSTAQGPVCTYTPLAVVSHARKTLRVSTTATDSANSDVSSKEGAVFGTVHMNNCSIKLKQ
jgi:hypothetical protein